jgi:tetratricopeptide (TPR) repeat protein
MRPKTLVSLLLVFAFVWFVVSTIMYNRDRVEVQLEFLRPLTLELWMVILAAFGAGAALILVFDITGGARRFVRNWKTRRVHRAHEKTEEVYLQGLDDLVNDRHQQALEAFDEVLSREPDHQNALLKRGDTLRVLERYEQAAESFDRVLQLAPENLMALYGLSDVHMDRGDEVQAELVLRRIMELDPKTTISAHRKLRDLKVKQKDWNAADELQQKIEKMVTLADEKVRARANSLGIRFELGLDQLSRGEFKEAIASFTSIIKKDKDFVPAYLKLGVAQMVAGDTNEGLATWHRSYEVTGSMEPLKAVQDHFLKSDDPDEAIRVWKQAIASSKNEAPLRYCLGKLYYRLFMLDAALDEFGLIEDSVCGLQALHVYTARILESQGDIQGALAKSKVVLGDVGGLMTDYSCSSCQKRFAEWQDRCDDCGNWNTIALDMSTAPHPTPSITPGPSWSVP